MQHSLNGLADKHFDIMLVQLRASNVQSGVIGRGVYPFGGQDHQIWVVEWSEKQEKSK